MELEKSGCGKRHGRSAIFTAMPDQRGNHHRMGEKIGALIRDFIPAFLLEKSK
jgi:hypothetical protein